MKTGRAGICIFLMPKGIRTQEKSFKGVFLCRCAYLGVQVVFSASAKHLQTILVGKGATEIKTAELQTSDSLLASSDVTEATLILPAGCHAQFQYF